MLKACKLVEKERDLSVHSNEKRWWKMEKRLVC